MLGAGRAATGSPVYGVRVGVGGTAVGATGVVLAWATTPCPEDAPAEFADSAGVSVPLLALVVTLGQAEIAMAAATTSSNDNTESATSRRERLSAGASRRGNFASGEAGFDLCNRKSPGPGRAGCQGKGV